MFASVGLLCLLTLPGAAAVEADVIIRGATLYDGSGQPGVVGDLAIKGDRIVAVGKFEAAGNPRVLDAAGLIVAPGFIDLHTHSDEEIIKPATRNNLNYLTQGVTTIVTGNCGFGPVDVAGYYKKIDEPGAGSNVIHQLPHGGLRQQVMGNVNRPPTPEEMAKMKALLDKGMDDGAWGFCTGLIYTPGMYATTDELAELAEVAAKRGGFYASHIRGEGTELLSSVDEAIEIGKRAKLPVHISHFKASGRKSWGKSADAIALIEQARSTGQIVTADQYPYTASSTSLTATLVPGAYREGKTEDLIARLNDQDTGPKLRTAIERAITDHDGGRSVRIASYSKRTDWQGKDLASIAATEKKPVLDLVLEILRSGGASIVNFGMSDEDLRLIMKQPFVATASDGGAKVPSTTVPHPRSYGCFPRKIGRYALEDKVVSLEQAIRSASGLPADILRLPKRGYLKTGYFADVVVFDPKAFRDTATYDQPHQYAAGVRWLFVNGVPTIEQGQYTGALAGRALRHGRQ
jgi:N-acyl-D-aspartate/D-glutamate deacylase